MWCFFVSVEPTSILIAEDNCKPENANTSVEIIDSNHSSMMQQLPNLPIMFKAFMSFVHGKSIMLGGSRLFQEEPWSEPQVRHECITLKGGTWSHHSHFNENRFSASLASTSSATFVFGGWKAPYTYEYLSKDSTTWVVGEEVIRAGFHWGSAVTISEEEIWLIGGSLSDFYHPTSRIISFDTINHIFSYLDLQLIKGRYGHQCAFIPETKTIMVTGGMNNWGDIEHNTELIDVQNRTVTRGPKLNNRRSDHGVGILKLDGKERVCVFGGCQKYEDPDESNPEPLLDSIEVYYPEKQKWQVADFTLGQPRKLFAFATIKAEDIEEP